MTRRTISIYAALSLCLSAASAAMERASIAVHRFIDLALAVLARPEPLLAGNGGFTGLLVDRRREYDVPPLHSLRHEAGTAQRGAHRNI